MLNRLAISGLVLVTALLVAGCGGDDQPKADAPSSQPSPTAPPGLDATEPPRPEDLSNTSASAVEYARWFAQLVQYGIETRNSRPIDAEAFDQASCQSCRNVADLISELKRTGYWQRSKEIELRSFRAVPAQDGVRVTGSFLYPEVEDVEIDGKVAEKVPATTYRYRADLTWNDTSETWRVKDFVYAKKA